MDVSFSGGESLRNFPGVGVPRFLPHPSSGSRTLFPLVLSQSGTVTSGERWGEGMRSGTPQVVWVNEGRGLESSTRCETGHPGTRTTRVT